jgi:hypothetical protein
MGPGMGQIARMVYLRAQYQAKSSYILIGIGISRGRRSADLPGLWMAIRPRAQWGQPGGLDNSKNWLHSPG